MRPWIGPPDHDRLPVTVLTGFLGSGKTTVLNHLVRQPELARTVVVINEFGAIGLDHDLIERSEAADDDGMVLLNSGCLCCTVRSDLVETLRMLAVRRERGEMPAFDRVIIETTGLADPAPILQTLVTTPLLAERYRVDGVVTTVDAFNGHDTLNQHEEAVKQAAMADRLLITKVDLATDRDLEALAARLHALNPSTPRLVVRQGEVAPAEVLALGLYQPERKSLDVQGWLRAEAFDHDHHHDHGHDHHHGHHHHHDVNRHDDRIRAVCLTVDQPIDGDSLDRWLETIMRLRGRDLLRIKGLLNIVGLSGPMVIHGVQHIFHPPIMLRRWPGEDRRSRIVFIVRDLSEADLRASLSLLRHPDTAA
ncbi:GTP-binding protein [Caenispirillum bisanense]|uniref:CobW family GTP-binding protein n=1 Tax=Caenispirillum bisanense TaxID=414052 RepID=UPI0031DC7753